MATRTWIRRLFARPLRTARRAALRHRPALEVLENRVVPSLTPTGYYSANGQAPGIPAPPGTYVATVGATAPTLDPVGYYTSQPASTAPIPAPAGSYVGTVGATAPTPDPVGTYTNLPGASSAIPAPAGSYVPTIGATAPTLDPLGTYTDQPGAAAPIPAPAGAYVGTVGATSATLDPMGTYTDQPGATAPILAPPGSFVGTVGATEATPDPLGSYTSQAGATAAIPAPPGSFVAEFGATAPTLDPLGTYSSQPGAVLPIPAPVGFYVGTVGATAPTRDPAGTYTNSEASTAPIPAPPGSFVGTTGATSATPDPLGTYTDLPGATAPIPAPAGSFVATTGATEPTLAPAGYYVPVTGASAATPAGAGFYVPTAGATQEFADPPGTTSGTAATAPTPVSASPTPPGYYSPTGQGPGTPAPPGSYVATYGATFATLDPPGYFTNLAGATAPIPAPPGTFIANAGATSATPDPMGTYTDQPGSTAALPAPPGTFVGTTGASAPTPDPLGTYTNLPGAAAPIAAPPGSYVATVGATSATLDPPGTYTNQSGSAAPILAPLGSYVPTAGATSATLAPAGTYTDQPGLAAPIAAPPGTFIANAGATSATPDALGTYTDQGGATAPILAPAGSFVATLGATEPTLAPPGYYVPLPGAAQAIAASPGFYVPTAGATREIADPPGTTSGIAATAPTAASLVVTTTADVVNPFDGVTSLREAIDYANTLAGPQTITFDPSLFANGSATITLSESDDFIATPAAFGITGSLTIQGPAAANGNGLTISVAASAAPMRLFDVDSGASLTLDDLELTGGVAQGDTATFGLGGAVYDRGNLTVQSCTIDGCSAIGGGGGVGVIGAADGRGGAIYGDDGSSVVIDDSTLSGNSAVGGPADPSAPGSAPGQGLGGAVFTHNGSVTILDSTLAYNTAAQGGGAVYAQGDEDTASVEMDNTIVADSTGGVSDFLALPSAMNGGAVTTGGTNNLILTNPDPTLGGFAGTNTITGQDPQLGKLTDNGGPTPTIAVSITSPAIGHADAALSEPLDQRNLARDSAPDIGAYENQAFSQLSPTTGLGSLITAGNTALLTSYKQAVTDVANLDSQDAVTALNTFTNTAVEDLTNPNSGVSLTGNFIPMMTDVGRVTIALGKTVFQPPAVVASYIGYLEAMANVVPGVPGIPGGLTGGNALVTPWVQVVSALVEQNFPTVVGSLNSFTSTAVGEAILSGSGVNVNTNLIPLVTDVAELTRTLGVTPVVVPASIYNQYIGDFQGMANAIPGGLTSGNTLATPWEQAVIGLVEQNFTGTFAALRSFITAAVGQAGSLGLTTLTNLEAPTLNLENLLLTPLSLQVPVPTVTPSVTSPAYGQSLSFTAVTTSGNVPPGTIQFSVDGVALGGPVSVVNGQAVSAVDSTLSPGTHVYSAVFAATNGLVTGVQSASLTVAVPAQSVYLLSPHASGALTASGNADVVLPGGLYVDSDSSSAILASGNARVNVGGAVLVVGGVSKSGNAAVTKTGAPAATSDPLAGMPLPSVKDSNGQALPSYGVVSVSGNSSKTLLPGIYSSIQISGNAQVTLSNSGTGIYIIKGGGLSVSGNASLSGKGVMIFNAGSAYDGTTDSGTEGGITLGGNGTITLSGPTSGPYGGIVIFQPASNSKALSLGGNGTAGITSTIYAPAATVGLSGNAQVNGTLVVSTLSVSGNAGAFQLSSGASSDYVASTSNWITNTVLTVAVEDDTGAGIDPDEVDRIGDAMSYLNTALGSFGVDLTWAAPGTAADVTIHFAITTPEGSAADGVLGFTTPANDVYLVEGWNFYTGADPTQVGAGQYDFQTLAEHELGHTVGLGESSDPGSVMYEYLAPGMARRTFTAGNLTAINSDADRFMKVEMSGPTRGALTAVQLTSAARGADGSWNDVLVGGVATSAPGSAVPEAGLGVPGAGGMAAVSDANTLEASSARAVDAYFLLNGDTRAEQANSDSGLPGATFSQSGDLGDAS
jgi:hypothetical protein